MCSEIRPNAKPKTVVGNAKKRHRMKQLAILFFSIFLVSCNQKAQTQNSSKQNVNMEKSDSIYGEKLIDNDFLKYADVTKYFVRENQFFANIVSYYSNQPATDAIHAVIPCNIFYISFNSFEKLFIEIPNLNIFFKSISESTLLNKIKDNDFLNFGNAKTKYCEFLRRYPVLAQQVPQQYIASYLKITPQSLSRIRNELIKKTKVKDVKA